MSCADTPPLHPCPPRAVLTPRLIRMESLFGGVSHTFEDRATLAMINRALSVPSFTHAEAGGVLTSTTAAVTRSYTLGGGFSASTLSVVGTAGGAFTKWTYGDAFPGNLLGTIRGQDGQAATPLNCTVNAGVDDNGEHNHCEWGLVSRDGWVVYDDTANVCLDGNDWWSNSGNRTCLASQAGTDAVNPANSAAFPLGTTVADEGACCDACLSDPSCVAGYVYDTIAGQSRNCWPLSSIGGRKAADSRILARTTNPASNQDVADLYGFFHGHVRLGRGGAGWGRGWGAPFSSSHTHTPPPPHTPNRPSAPAGLLWRARGLHPRGRQDGHGAALRVRRVELALVRLQLAGQHQARRRLRVAPHPARCLCHRHGRACGGGGGGEGGRREGWGAPAALGAL